MNVMRRFFKKDAPLQYDEKMNNLALPEDIWIEILQRVDDKCLFQCSRVCRVWRNILNSAAFWSAKCKYSKVVTPPLVEGHSTDYRKIYYKKPFGRNLIKNPSGEDGKLHWDIVLNGGDGFRIEKPPHGSDTEDFPVCFATSYGVCVKQQVIDLEQAGVDLWIINKLQPKITVSEWHAARFDCASIYKLHVVLLRNPPVSPATRHNDHFFWDHDDNGDNGPFFRQPSGSVVAEYFKPTIVEQWLGRNWEETRHVFENYGPSVKYILFQTYGKDRQFWAGHYGPKMAKAFLSLTF